MLGARTRMRIPGSRSWGSMSRAVMDTLVLVVLMLVLVVGVGVR